MDGSPAPMLVSCRREGDTVSVTLSGGEVLVVAAAALPGDLPPPGSALPPAQLAALRQADARKRIARRVFDLLDRRLWPARRLRGRLLGDGFEAAAVDEVLARFEDEGLLSDRRYAEAYIRDTLSARAVGARYLRARLQAQGITAADAAAAIGALLPPAREAELARAAARGRWARARGGGAPELASVIRFLQARGFPPALARSAARAEAPGAAGGPGGDGAEDAER